MIERKSSACRTTGDYREARLHDSFSRSRQGCTVEVLWSDVVSSQLPMFYRKFLKLCTEHRLIYTSREELPRKARCGWSYFVHQVYEEHLRQHHDVYNPPPSI